MTFGMVTMICCCSKIVLNHPKYLGPLLEDGSPYSALCKAELCCLINLNFKSVVLDPVPNHVSCYKYWQYGQGQHSSTLRDVISSFKLDFSTDIGTHVTIKHLVVNASSQWLIGKCHKSE